MSSIEIEETQPLARSYARSVLSNCPQCDGDAEQFMVLAA